MDQNWQCDQTLHTYLNMLPTSDGCVGGPIGTGVRLYTPSIIWNSARDVLGKRKPFRNCYRSILGEYIGSWWQSIPIEAKNPSNSSATSESLLDWVTWYLDDNGVYRRNQCEKRHFALVFTRIPSDDPSEVPHSKHHLWTTGTRPTQP